MVIVKIISKEINSEGTGKLMLSLCTRHWAEVPLFSPLCRLCRGQVCSQSRGSLVGKQHGERF